MASSSSDHEAPFTLSQKQHTSLDLGQPPRKQKAGRNNMS